MMQAPGIRNQKRQMDGKEKEGEELLHSHSFPINVSKKFFDGEKSIVWYQRQVQVSPKKRKRNKIDDSFQMPKIHPNNAVNALPPAERCKEYAIKYSAPPLLPLAPQ